MESSHAQNGEMLDLKSNELLVLDGPAALYVLESGSVAVSVARAERGAATGPRRPLYRAGVGHALVVVPMDAQPGLRLLCTPLEDTRARKAPLAEASAALIEDWVRDLGVLLTEGQTEPAVSLRPASGEPVALPTEQTLRPQPDDVFWCRLSAGAVRCAGDGMIEITSADGPLPLSGAMWVEAIADAQIEILSTADLPPEARESGLALLSRIVLAHLASVVEAERVRERRRLDERVEHQARATADAIDGLARVLDPRDEPRMHDTPLMSALGAVTDALGITLQAPGASEGARASDPVAAIARASGFRTREVLLEGDWWHSDCGPLLARSADDERRPLALLQGRGLRYEIYDPATRKRTRVDRRTNGMLAPQALTVYRPLPSGPIGLKDLWRFTVRGRGKDVLFIVLAAMFGTLLGMLTPQATAMVMDSAIPDANRQRLLELGLVLVAAAIGQGIFRLAQGFVTTRLSSSMQMVSQAAVWDRLLALRPAFFRRFSSGDLQRRAMAVSQISQELGGATLVGGMTSLMALLNLVLLFVYSPLLAFIAVGVVIVAVGFTAFLSARIRRRARVLQEQQGKFYGFEVQLVGGVSKLRVAGAEPRAYARWVRDYAAQMREMLAVQRLEDVASLFNAVLPLVATALLYWFGYAQLSTGLSIGLFLAFSAAFATFLGGATGLGNTVIGLLDTLNRAHRIRPLLEAEPEVDAGRPDPGRLQGRVALDRVVFRYREDGPKILDGVSMKVEPGSFVALVGTSGSGKSTLFRMLLGFEAPESGTVSYDGQDLAGIDVRAVRRQLGVVLQGGRLNTASVFDNIAAGSLITLEQAWDAVRAAGMEEDLGAMPMGMHTLISEGGGNLSGGQRQRLLIARALVHRPQILFFDEATSALDNRTQAIVTASLRKRNVTRVVIAHRLSTIRDADCIYVLDGGKIVQSGTFAELSEAEGIFKRIMARQMA